MFTSVRRDSLVNTAQLPGTRAVWSVYIVYSSVLTVCTQFSVYSVGLTVTWVQCEVYSGKCTVQSNVHSVVLSVTVQCVQCGEYTVQCVQCGEYTVQCVQCGEYTVTPAVQLHCTWHRAHSCVCLPASARALCNTDSTTSQICLGLSPCCVEFLHSKL